jgi:hypothetical protein
MPAGEEQFVLEQRIHKRRAFSDDAAGSVEQDRVAMPFPLSP